MSDPIPADSVGVVTPKLAHFSEPLKLAGGSELAAFDLVFETYGTLNEARDNAVLICHALSGDHHAAGYHSEQDLKPGWWEACIGPGKALDTNRFFVVCPNNLGGCGGSSGPLSIDQETGNPYGPDFPIVTVADWVESQARLADHLGIERWAAVMGGSLGGMQALQWAIDFPARVRHALVIAAASKLSPQNIAFNEIARQAIRNDPSFNEGRYQDIDQVPESGLRLARMLGHVTYLSDDALLSKFGRELRDGKLNFGYDVDFEIESYLRYQGESFVGRFDANTYLLMTKALDYFDPAKDHGDDFTQAVAHCQAKFLVVSFSTDWRFSPSRSREIVGGLLDADRDVTYVNIDSELGHDSFLLPIPNYLDVLGAYLNGIEINQ
ncbi:MAG: homoserine O-acetyltransferase [Pseudomonadota bacterium]